MKKLVIFGLAEAAELALYYFSSDSDYEVEAFVVDAAFMPSEKRFKGLPVVAFDEATQIYPPDRYAFFVALGYSKLNAIRKDKYLAVKALGYELASYISSRASILTEDIGENCFILEDNTIQPFVRIGNNVTMWSGNHIGHHSRIEDHCFLASHIVVSGRVTIKESCFLGVNATLRDHVTIGEKCIIGAGVLILADAAAEGVYVGTATERSRVPSTRVRNI
jgi:sugar O-acyltransferase (sialic acid O-acetyltransferase NeuD family)